MSFNSGIDDGWTIMSKYTTIFQQFFWNSLNLYDNKGLKRLYIKGEQEELNFYF